jgi:hypothetical protein
VTRRQYASRENLAASLLAAVPACLLSNEGREFVLQCAGVSGSTAVSTYLASQLAKVLAGETEATDDVERLTKAVSPVFPGNDQQVAAAWDAFYRAAGTEGPSVVSHVLSSRIDAFAPLPLIDSVLERFPVEPQPALADADLLACRHLMGSTVAEIGAMQQAVPGLDCFGVIGKPYSANQLVALELQRRAVRVDLDSLTTGPLSQHPFGAYAGRHRVRARQLVRDFLDNSPETDRPLVVVDDGGALIDAVGQKVLAGEIQRPVVAVEQTTHGMFAVRHFLSHPVARRHGFAVISVAESRTKLGDESALITSSVADTTAAWLNHLYESRRIITRSPVGVLGFGILGMSIARTLRERGMKVIVFDRNNRKAATAHDMGFESVWSVGEVLSQCRLVIGASGGTAVNEEATSDLLDGTILVSVSSGDKEFSGLNLWDVNVEPILPDDKDLTAFDQAHGLAVATNPQDGRVVYLPNRGFPVNFDGSLDPIRREEIQLTRALMVGAILQAAGSSPLGKPFTVGDSGEFQLHREIDRYIHDTAPTFAGGSVRLRR